MCYVNIVECATNDIGRTIEGRNAGAMKKYGFNLCSYVFIMRQKEWIKELWKQNIELYAECTYQLPDPTMQTLTLSVAIIIWENAVDYVIYYLCTHNTSPKNTQYCNSRGLCEKWCTFKKKIQKKNEPPFVPRTNDRMTVVAVVWCFWSSALLFEWEMLLLLQIYYYLYLLVLAW